MDEVQMTKRRGAILTEVLISMLVFVVAISSLWGGLALNLRGLLDSGTRIQAGESTINAAYRYIGMRSIERAGDPADAARYGEYAPVYSSDKTIEIGDKTLECEIYKYTVPDKSKSNHLYILRRKVP